MGCREKAGRLRTGRNIMLTEGRKRREKGRKAWRGTLIMPISHVTALTKLILL